jgi:hypothetical protein
MSTRPGRLLRRAALFSALAAAPALAYLLPAGAVLKRLALRREELALQSLEVRGTFAMGGEGAKAAAAATGLPLAGPELSAPAFLGIKMPGRCRLELAPLEVTESERPVALVRHGRVSGLKGLDRVAPAQALLRGVCALLSERPGGAEPDRPYGEELSRHGVDLGRVFLGRFAGRVAYVLGAKPSERAPQAWVDKQTFQPARLLFSIGASFFDVRLLDYGSPTGGDWFPRAVEVYEGGELRARFTTEKAVANPKLSDAMF